jgi:thymidylate synthase (FAD)
MVSACLEIETTRDIARQILRHRSFSFQEFSQRYAVADLGWELKETRLQDTKNRQNSIALSGLTLKEQNLMEQWKGKQEQLIQDAEYAYDWAITNGIAKEQARAVLPEGLTVSRLYMQGTLRSWLHYIELRSGPETQKEHRQVAQACAGALESIFPMVTEFLVK